MSRLMTDIQSDAAVDLLSKAHPIYKICRNTMKSYALSFIHGLGLLVILNIWIFLDFPHPEQLMFFWLIFAITQSAFCVMEVNEMRAEAAKLRHTYNTKQLDEIMTLVREIRDNPILELKIEPTKKEQPKPLPRTKIPRKKK